VAPGGRGAIMTDVLNGIALAGGWMLRDVFAALLRVRRPRPIHPRGRILEGWITWLPRAATSGIGWIDAAPPAPQRVIARLSRSLGLPDPLPDVIGLALRVDHEGRPADLELASTGLGIPSRFLLIPRRSPSRTPLTTILPYRGEDGPVLVAARTLGSSLPASGPALDAALASDGWRLRLYHAAPTGLWHPFAEVSLRASDSADDARLRFDAGRHPLPGSREYEWVRALRDPSYRRVQHPDLEPSVFTPRR
jgi:hypothetical protein